MSIPPFLTTNGMAPASPAEVTESLAYVLGFDERGRPRAAGWDFVASMAAEKLFDHLTREGFVIMRQRGGLADSEG